MIKGPVMLFQWLEPQQNPLVKPFYKRFMAYSRPNKADKIAILRDEQSHHIIACARLRPIGQYWLLTGMLVHPEYRGQQLGPLLLQHMQCKMLAQPTFTFALTPLTDFYSQQDFVVINDAPNDIQQRFESYKNQGKDLTLMMFNKP